MITAKATRREGYRHSVAIGDHTIVLDEPTDRGGTDAGPSPTQLLAVSLAACTAVTVEMYAERKGWELGTVEATASYEPVEPGERRSFEVKLSIGADVDEETEQRLLKIARRCPVHRSLAEGCEVTVADAIERA